MPYTLTFIMCDFISLVLHGAGRGIPDQAIDAVQGDMVV